MIPGFAEPMSFPIITLPGQLSIDAYVSDLIDSTMETWKWELISEVFLDVDVVCIKHIPLSLFSRRR